MPAPLALRYRLRSFQLRTTLLMRGSTRQLWYPLIGSWRPSLITCLNGIRARTVDEAAKKLRWYEHPEKSKRFRALRLESAELSRQKLVREWCWFFCLNWKCRGTISKVVDILLRLYGLLVCVLVAHSTETYRIPLIERQVKILTPGTWAYVLAREGMEAPIQSHRPAHDSGHTVFKKIGDQQSDKVGYMIYRMLNSLDLAEKQSVHVYITKMFWSVLGNDLLKLN